MKKPKINFNDVNPVSLCDNCSEIIAIQKATAIIESSNTQEHLDVAMNYLDLYLKTYSNAATHLDLIHLLRDRKIFINSNNANDASNKKNN